MRIRNLKDLNRRIHELEAEEQQNREIARSVSGSNPATSQVETAIYIGRIAAEVFKAWRQPADSKSDRWKNVITSILLMVGIKVAQNYLDQKLGEDNGA